MDEELTPEQAAVFCAVHGFQLWEDTTDMVMPWAVERNNWRTWYWTEELTAANLRIAMDRADGDPEAELDPDFRKLLYKTIVRIELPPLSPRSP